MRGVVGGVLRALAWLFVVVNICMGAKNHYQNGCYKTDVILTCPYYTHNKIGKLVWRFKDKTAGKWKDLASIINGNRNIVPHNSTLDERITIHLNGSLGIASLHPDDETMFQCKAYVEGLGLRVHVTDLKVSCGKVTLIKREVCADDDVMLECDAWHRTNPRKLHQVKWHKKNPSGNDVSWSLLVASSGSNVTVGNGFKLHGNGSLQLHGGRAEKVVTYKCDVTKNVLSRLDRHIIVVKSVECRREKREITAGSVKTTAGRVAMTTPRAVTMETSYSPSSATSTDHVYTGAKNHYQNGCYKTDVILTCPYYTHNKIGKLVWRFKDKTAGKWKDLASIINGNRNIVPHNSTLDERITIHLNGSLGIASLHPDDETMFQCKAYVEGLGLRVHVTDLKVSCGKITLIKREVCADDDVMLECDARHRTNPRKLHQVKWHKMNPSGNDVSWSLLVASSGSNLTVGFKLHGNGSLQLHGGRAEKVVTYKCDVTKNVPSRLDRHIIVVKSVECRREKREITAGSPLKTNAGRVATTTPITITMETITPSVFSAVSPVHGTKHIFLVSVIIIVWLLMNLSKIMTKLLKTESV